MRTITCNKCGRPIDEHKEGKAQRLNTVLGYGSKYDGCLVDLDLCPDCVDELIDSCKISPLDT